MTPAMLKRADGSLMKFTGLCYTTIFKLERDGKFPARRQISPGRVAWLTSEVQEWMLQASPAAPFPKPAAPASSPLGTRTCCTPS